MITQPLSQLKKAARIWDKARRSISAYLSRPHATSTQDGCHPKESTLEILKTLRERRKALPLMAGAGDYRLGRKQQPDECSAQKHEYLSIALPMSASCPVEILGSPENVNLKFVRRAEHVLTILRVVSSHLDSSTQFSELAHADQLLKEVAGLLCGIESRQEKNRKCSTCQMKK